MEAIARTRDFIGEGVEELRKVTWPDRGQLRNATFVVIVFVIIIAIIIWGMDVVIRSILNVIIGMFAG
jgi:preprotein translocase subunit SecE